jgi:hypothetical protein
MGVAEGVDAEAAHQVEIAVAGGVVEVHPLAVVHDDGVAGVDGDQSFRVAVENMVGIGVLPEIRHDLSI